MTEALREVLKYGDCRPTCMSKYTWKAPCSCGYEAVQMRALLALGGKEK